MAQQKYLFIVLSLCCLSSCAPRIYNPDRANVPAFTGAHEINVVLSVKPQAEGTNSSWFAPAADVSFAPINHFGIIASYRTMINTEGYLYPVNGDPDNYSSYFKNVVLNGHRFEAGLGYFTGISPKGVFEVFGGYGIGTLSGADDFGTINFNTEYRRFFLQPEIGHRGEIFTFMFGARIVRQQYYNFQTSDSGLVYKINTEEFASKPDNFTSEKFVFIEPFADLSIGYKYIFFNAQFGFTAQMGNYAPITSDLPIFVSVGASFHFKPEKKKGVKDE